MANYPIPEQSGLSEDQLAKMKVSSEKQKFTDLIKKDITLYQGVISQKVDLTTNIRKNIIDYEKARMDADYSDSYAVDNCIKNFVDDLVITILQFLQAQKISVSTEVKVNVTTTNNGELQEDGKSVIGTGSGTGTGSGISNSVGIE